VSQQLFFPYATVHGSLDASWQLSGAEHELTASRAFRLTDDLPPSGRLTLAVESKIPEDARLTAFPEAERRAAPSQVLLVVRSGSSRIRLAATLTEAEPNTFGGSVELPGSILHGELEAFVALVRTSDGHPHAGFASHKGAILGTSEIVKVQLEEPPSPPGGHLEIAYEDFRSSPNALRRNNSDRMFALDMEAEMPKLWLNESIPELVKVTQSRARRGVPRRIRDATFDTIVVQTWTSLISSAVAALAISLTDDVEYSEAVDSLDDWQRRVLHFWAPRLYPELSDAGQALDAVCQAAAGRERLPHLFERMTLATQVQAGSTGAFDGLVRVMTGEGV
jgi:hypothetical protein